MVYCGYPLIGSPKPPFHTQNPSMARNFKNKQCQKTPLHNTIIGYFYGCILEPLSGALAQNTVKLKS